MALANPRVLILLGLPFGIALVHVPRQTRRGAGDTVSYHLLMDDANFSFNSTGKAELHRFNGLILPISRLRHDR
jgi:hypothetical protein